MVKKGFSLVELQVLSGWRVDGQLAVQTYYSMYQCSDSSQVVREEGLGVGSHFRVTNIAELYYTSPLPIKYLRCLSQTTNPEVVIISLY